MENYTHLGNYYGYLSLIEQNGKYYLSLDDHSSTNYLEIDQITYENLLRFSDVETKPRCMQGLTINGDDDGISIIGFDDEIDNLSDVDTPEEEIKLVEVRNYHSDDDGGLSKRASKDIRVIYFKVVDYFNEQDNIEVVDSLGDYF